MQRLATLAFAFLMALSLAPQAQAETKAQVASVFRRGEQRHRTAEARPRDLNTNRWVRQQLLAADRHIVRQEPRQAFRILEDTRRHLIGHPDRRYQRPANWIYDVQQDLRAGQFHNARNRIGYIMQNLPQVGQGQDRMRVRHSLEQALSALRINDLRRAGFQVRSAYDVAYRSSDYVVRNSAQEIGQAYEYIRQGRARSAGRVCRFVIQRLSHQGLRG